MTFPGRNVLATLCLVLLVALPAAAFLRLYLRNDASAAATLHQTAPMLPLYRYDM